MITLSKFDVGSCIVILSLISVSVYQHVKTKSVAQPKSNILGVKALIEQVRSELLSIDKNRVNGVNQSLFQLQDFDLEIKFVVNEKETLSGKVEFEVVTVGGDKSITHEKVQTIKLHMSTFPTEKGEVGAADESVTPVDQN